MRFMIIAKATKEDETGPPPPPEAFVAMQKYNEELAQAGMLLAAEGLMPTSHGARVEFNGDERRLLDGPFTETKELIAGFTIIKANSLQEAIDVVKRAPTIFRDRKSVVEIRRLMDIEDFGEGFVPNEEVAKVKF